MRFDQPRYFRQSMSWVHTWTGLLMGWLLFAVYVTGSLSYFRNEITLWMQPELHAATPDANWLPRAINLLNEQGSKAQQWTINPPGPRSSVVGLSYREGTPGGRQQEMGGAANGPQGQQGQQNQQGQPPERDRGVKRLTMDPATGEVLEARTTAGGNFLYRFHYQLHGMDRMWGRWIVGIATMLMFIAIITGVIVHRNIFKDFFTFRPAKGKRSWLDGHNATGVLALPFHILITFSGLLLLAAQLMPWAADALYAGDRRAYMQDVRGGGAGRETPAVAGQTAQAGGRGEERERGSEDGRRGDRANRGGGKEPAALTDLRPLYAQALHQWPKQGVGAIVVTNPGKSNATVEIRQAFGEQLTARGGAERLLFNGLTGESLETLETPTTQAPSFTRSIWNVLTTVHEGRFATAMVRWLLFLCGVLGSAMVASGLVLWVVSRQKERQALGRAPLGHRFVEIMNVGAVSGLLLAIAAFFWANRLIPAALENRSALEIQTFFVIWGLAFVHALLRRHKQAWVEQLSAGAAMFVLIPMLNGLTGGAHLGRSLLQGHWQVASFDIAVFVTGILMLFIAYRLHLYVPKPSKKGSNGLAIAEST
ncbi:PepSY-associated TM helix domain-containing protein [Propionivibrio limicola]|uniref:PepSY-associated TM helix domain-containing protein n=1 Tax=Propionivibrio limicola TaxID=167645 RepID=UPI001292A0F3|nr:PepSY-associated TM helix domain-containing protein [Propionivibrio limicola]